MIPFPIHIYPIYTITVSQTAINRPVIIPTPQIRFFCNFSNDSESKIENKRDIDYV